MERYKISVIIPVYNVVRYLPKCIDSVRNQTYQNLEILVIDDGSTDGCGEICDAYAKKDERIRVVHQKNQGLSAARNRALDIMTGDLVGFVDSDDWIEPDYYEVLEKHMRKTGADIVTSGYYYVYQDKVIKSRINHQEAPYDKYSGLKALSEHKIPHVVWNKLYRKNLFAALKFIEGRTYEDVLITYRLIMRAERIECMDIYGYHQTMRAGSIVHCPGGVVEDFSAHYELWQNVKAQKYLEHIPEEIIDNFFKDTVVFAYLTLYKNFNLCREKHPELFLQTKEFWNKNRKEIASINRKFWLIVYVPFPFRLKGWIRKEFPKLWIVLRKCRRILGRNSEGKLFE